MSETDDVLTPEESEALLEDSEESSSERESDQGLRELDSSYWEQLSPDRLPALEAITEAIAEGIGEIWEKNFKRSIEVSSTTPKWLAGKKINERIEDEEYAALVEVVGANNEVLVITSMDSVSAMVDLYFGGSGTAKRSARLAEMTSTEKRLLDRFVGQLLECFSASWQRYGTKKFKISSEEFSSDNCSLCESAASIVLSSFVFVLGENKHEIDVVWPVSMIEPLRDYKPKALPAASSASGVNWSSQMREDLKSAHIELRAVTSDFTVRLLDISKAKPGDIIPTDSLNAVRICVGNQPLFEGTLGAHRGFNAVKIRHPVNKKVLENV